MNRLMQSAYYSGVILLALVMGCNLTLSPGEGGQIVSASGGMDCPNASCTFDIPVAGMIETFTAVPDEGYVFTGWGIPCQNNETDECVVDLSPRDAAIDYTHSLEAHFETAPSGLSGTYTKVIYGVLNDANGDGDADDFSGIADITFDGISAYSVSGTKLQRGQAPSAVNFGGTYTVDTDGKFELADSSGKPTTSGFVSADGTFYVETTIMVAGQKPFIAAGLKNTRNTNDAGTLSGTYTRVIYMASGDVNGDGDADDASGIADITFDGISTYSASGTTKQWGQPTTSINFSGTYTVDADGKFELADSSGNPRTTGIVSEDGNTYIGVASLIDGRTPFIVVGIKNTSSTNAETTLAGTYHRVLYRSYTDADSDGDRDDQSDIGDTVFDGISTFNASAVKLQVGQTPETITYRNTYRVDANGKFQIGDLGYINGVVSEDGSLYIDALSQSDNVYSVPLMVIGIRK